VWFYDYTAPFMFKDVEGDFMVTTRIRVAGTSADYPQSTYSLAGLMVRRPRTDGPYSADEKWPKDRENYVFAVTGTTDSAGVPILETKSAVRSQPLVKHYRLEQKGWLDLRLARVDRSVLVLYRPEGGDWVVHERFYRPDLPPKVQVGVMAYSDFETIDQKHWYRPWEYNRKVIAEGRADLRAQFDWVRFQRVAAPAPAQAQLQAQRITWDDHRITNADLLRLLPFLANAAASNQTVQTVQPERVLPDVISTPRNETFPSIDPVDGSLWFSVYADNFDGQSILRAARSGTGWSAPAAVPFSTGQWGDRAPRFSPDGQRLYISSNRPTPSNAAGGDFNLWVLQRGANGWSEPRLLPEPVNSSGRDYHSSETRAGDLYVASNRPGGAGRSDIYRFRRTGESWTAGSAIGAPINDALGQPDLLVAPDGTWMILVITDHPQGLGGDDLFLSRFENGHWSALKHLPAPINSSEYEYGPSLSPDGRTLYFTSHRGGNADVYRIPVAALGLAR
jgi:regulation of enolase protein 1 (concanavalin A-like superfamily)